MPISQEDIAFMEEVAAYYRSSEEHSGQESSILATAKRFKISRNKVRKILVTTGDVIPSITPKVMTLRSMGMSIKEIASELGISVATVSTALPYTDKFNNSLAPGYYASKARMYRAYERRNANNQVGMQTESERHRRKAKGTIDMEDKEWQKDIKMSYYETYHRPHRDTWDDMDEMRKELLMNNPYADDPLFKELMEALQQQQEEEKEEEEEIRFLESKTSLTDEEKERLADLKYQHGLYPGALNSRHRPTLEAIAGGRLPPEPSGVMRLHLELCGSDETARTTRALKKYAGLKYGNTISRDIVVPYDIALFALHYVIQRAFGWQNSHLYEYTLPDDCVVPLTHDNASMWSCLVGVLFQSPLMDEDEEFWADDYEQGSFKNWLRKKYTGPYMSQCQGEGLYSCQSDMMELDMEEKFYILYEKKYDHKKRAYSDTEYISAVQPVHDNHGKKLDPPAYGYRKDAPRRLETVSFKEIPAMGLFRIFEHNPFSLLKRLPLFGVLFPGKDRLSDDEAEQEYIQDNIMHYGEEVYYAVEKYVRNIISSGTDTPLAQVTPPAVTGTLYYTYDFGDNWTIKITASENCPDLVESGRITQAELDQANVKCRETYRPVLLARDGEMLIDDVGGIHGFAEFLETINPDLEKLDDADSIAEAKNQKKESLEWAKSMGWKRKDNSTILNWL